jgi:hypothetical protein
MNSIGKAFDSYLSSISTKKRKSENLQILFWNFLRINIIAYNEDEHLVLLKSTRKFYKLSRNDFYLTIGKYLNTNGTEMLEVTRYPESIDAMIMTALSGKKTFSNEFFIYKNYLFYYWMGEYYPTVINVSVEDNYGSTNNMLIRLIDPHLNTKILDFSDFKMYAGIENPPYSLVYDGSAEILFNIFPNKYCQILRQCREKSYHDIPDKHIIYRGSELQIELYTQLFAYIPVKDICAIIDGYLRL